MLNAEIDANAAAARAAPGAACRSAADAYWHGPRGVKKSVPRALKLLNRGCNGGDPVACTNAAVLYTGAGAGSGARARRLGRHVRAVPRARVLGGRRRRLCHERGRRSGPR